MRGVSVTNPFVGPRPLAAGDPIFGRDREISELRYLLAAERIVLLYSPSGAGKSSLIAAGLIPKIGARFDVLAPARVGLAPPAGLTAANRYAWSAAASFEQGIPQADRRTSESLAPLCLKDAIEG